MGNLSHGWKNVFDKTTNLKVIFSPYNYWKHYHYFYKAICNIGPAFNLATTDFLSLFALEY